MIERFLIFLHTKAMAYRTLSGQISNMQHKQAAFAVQSNEAVSRWSTSQFGPKKPGVRDWLNMDMTSDHFREGTNSLDKQLRT